MSSWKRITVGAILALGAAGSIAPALAMATPAAATVASAPTAVPYTWYHM